ncbi:GNAT family N-acetyltransferase [Iningainema tapete]|uniref:GNAT family N-acetyltransferase n=1 Tax=Iningainema tapete BLCC-T55 TaxID=2748662 RepID=A0A8J6XPT8_9CYAN|nr:GNAT family N-acetyltransferase [Iningainema tapete]MBD2774217.1 GNAT family N-acetyltransferase [Iningainema tapete BLCC-T55]
MDSRIQSYLRVAASHQRDTERIGPFLATFTHHNDNPFLNYAIPDDDATPSSADVAALIAAYERRSRIPRLEYYVPYNRDRTTEIAGIGVRAKFRRRGIAGALTTQLVRLAIDAGVSLAFLMAAHEAEARIYFRAGFSTIGEILHISHPREQP